MALYHQRAKNQDAELRAAFKVFDKDSKGYIDWNTLKVIIDPSSFQHDSSVNHYCIVKILL